MAKTSQVASVTIFRLRLWGIGVFFLFMDVFGKSSFSSATCPGTALAPCGLLPAQSGGHSSMETLCNEVPQAPAPVGNMPFFFNMRLCTQLGIESGRPSKVSISATERPIRAALARITAMIWGMTFLIAVESGSRYWSWFFCSF